MERRAIYTRSAKPGFKQANVDGSLTELERGEWRCSGCGELLAETSWGRDSAVLVDSLTRLADRDELPVFGLPRRTIARGKSRRQVKRHALSADIGRQKSTPLPFFVYCPRRDLGCGILQLVG